MVGLLCTGITQPAAAPVPGITLSYTNSAGVSGRTATIVSPSAGQQGLPSSSRIGALYPFRLDTGDLGVRSIQSYTADEDVSGTLSLVMYRSIAYVSAAPYCGMTPMRGQYSLDPISGALPRIYNNSVLFLMEMMDGSGARNLGARITLAQG
jgi:hypothetical protein